jgi:myosin heavy subunit
LNFNQAGFLTGASISTYLLEKSRVIRQGEKERSFHIFYQLLSGASADQRKNLYLKDANSYEYLNKSGCTTIHNVNDTQEFKDTINAMQIMAMKPEEIDSLLRIIAGMVHL